METFTEFKPMVLDPCYQDRKQRHLNELGDAELDAPIADLVGQLSGFTFCFTIQSCFGHFLYSRQKDPKNIDPLPSNGKSQFVEYRIAYIAFCVENSQPSREFLRRINQISEIDPDFIQFGCAEWFWERNPNSYVLQVEPKRFMLKDNCTVAFSEALHVEKVRDEFYDQLKMLVSKYKKS